VPKLRIDNREVAVESGHTILDAARKLGIHIPTLCFRQGQEPNASCMVCVVKLKGQPHLVPACATRAEDGMEVESETPEVHQARRRSLELLLGDHLGDCEAPCQSACPAHMDIPRMIRQIAAGSLRDAIATVKADIPLPAVLGRICPAPCEKVCRRAAADEAVCICLLKRYAADADLASVEPYLPDRRSGNGKRVGIVGAGPAGLSAAYYLLQEGYSCTLLDEHDQPGGALRYGVDEAKLPREVLDAEIETIHRLGAEFRLGVRVGAGPSVAGLQSDFDALLIAVGQVGADQVAALELETSPAGIRIDRNTYQTSTAGVFAAGDAVRARRLAVCAVADGKGAAAAIDQHLSGREVTGAARPFTTRMGRLEKDEIQTLLAGASRAGRIRPAQGRGAGFAGAEAAAEAHRCLHCDCRKATDCSLRRYAAAYAARPGHYKGQRRRFEQFREHPQVIYEPGKCISCGLCVQIAAKAGEPFGLAFIGRGFDVRVAVPFRRSLAEALGKAAAECVAACPTGALAFKEET